MYTFIIIYWFYHEPLIQLRLLNSQQLRWLNSQINLCTVKVKSHKNWCIFWRVRTLHDDSTIHYIGMLNNIIEYIWFITNMNTQNTLNIYRFIHKLFEIWNQIFSKYSYWISFNRCGSLIYSNVSILILMYIIVL